MKNKPDPALSGGSYLFNEIKKRTLNSHETIPLIQGLRVLSTYRLLASLRATSSKAAWHAFSDFPLQH
jgi:hypothetical protein